MRYTVFAYKTCRSTRGIEIGWFKDKILAIRAGSELKIADHPWFGVYDNFEERWLGAADGL